MKYSIDGVKNNHNFVEERAAKDYLQCILLFQQISDALIKIMGNMGIFYVNFIFAS